VAAAIGAGAAATVDAAAGDGDGEGEEGGGGGDGVVGMAVVSITARGALVAGDELVCCWRADR
jgi:hypothetical protein